ncbi:MAG: hypothetical protein JWO78_1638 [Micavibrio sp.]|nr:hypothetical protein [Micavibrio sp.]
MTTNAETSPPDQTDPAEAARVTQARAEKAESERDAVQEAREKYRQRNKSGFGLSSLFNLAGSYLLLNNMPSLGKLGKGSDCVVDHGSYIYVPAKATEAHLRQVAQLLQQKGWTAVAVHKEKGKGLHEQFSGALKQILPNLDVCMDLKAAGSVYGNRRQAIMDYCRQKAMNLPMSHAPAPVTAQPA